MPGPRSHPRRPSRHTTARTGAAWIMLLLIVPVLAGCIDGPENGDDRPGDGQTPRPTPGGPGRLWTNPYDLDLHFDGGSAYDLALRQMYTDPVGTTGERYRIPGTADHAAVAEELLEWLDEPLRALGGRASISHFDGATYYDVLDLTPVQQYVSDPWCADGARERVRDLQFMNIIGRTSNTEIGMIIGAHWDTKRYADHDPDPANHDRPLLGADDGAASTAAVIGLARAFAADPPGMPLTFVLFDGEDGFDRRDCHPLAGSLHYAQSLSEDEKATMDGLILLDMIGNASATFYREGHSKRYAAPSGSVDSSWLGDLVWQTAAEMEVAAFVDQNTSPIMDDHVPFLYEGLYAIDILRFEQGFPEYWHTVRDDHTAIQPEGIDQVGAVVEASIRLYARSR